MVKCGLDPPLSAENRPLEPPAPGRTEGQLALMNVDKVVLIEVGPRDGSS